MKDKDQSPSDPKKPHSSKCDFLFKYENVIKVDLLVLVFHLLAIYVVYNVYMFTTIILVRLPRLALGLGQLLLRRNVKNKTKAMNMLEAEFKIRLATTVIMFFASIIISFIFINKKHCNQFTNKEAE